MSPQQGADIPLGVMKVLEQLSFAVNESRPAAGGDINRAGIVSAADGGQLFVKWNFDAPVGFFEAEAHGLRLLAAAKAIKIPEVVSVSDSSPPCLVLEALKPGPVNEERLGREVALLHQNSADYFGLERDNFIGRMPQRNKQHSAWADFFFEQRLLPQIEIAQTAGWFDWSFERLFEAKHETIKKLLEGDGCKPSLLHGDLWGGNVFWSKEGPALIDPAVYYGSPETDLAFTELFGGFGPRFYSAYREVNPAADGYKERKPILNLYHLLNHANTFGGSYIRSVADTLKKI